MKPLPPPPDPTGEMKCRMCGGRVHGKNVDRHSFPIREGLSLSCALFTAGSSTPIKISAHFCRKCGPMVFDQLLEWGLVTEAESAKFFPVTGVVTPGGL